MKKILFLLLIGLFTHNFETSAQWTAFDSSSVRAGGLQCIGTANGSDTVYIFSVKNNMYVCNYPTMTLLDSSYYAGNGYPRELVQVNKTNGIMVYRCNNGFGSPWWTRKVGTTETSIGGGFGNFEFSDVMMYSPSGVLFYRKKKANGFYDVIYKSTDDGAVFSPIFTNTKGASLSGIAEDGSVFVHVESKKSGGTVTFDSAATYKSMDNGTTWIKVYDYNNPDTVGKIRDIRCIGTECYALAEVIRNSGSNEYDAFFYSPDNGDSWMLKSVLAFKSLGPQSWAVDESGNVYYADNNDIFRSVDKGATFIAGFRGGIPSSGFITGIYSTNGKVFTMADGTLYTLGGSLTANFTGRDYRRLELFPNPSASFFYLRIPEEMQDGIITIYNSTGEIILQQEARPIWVSPSMEGMPKGIYYINVSKNEKSISAAFVIE